MVVHLEDDVYVSNDRFGEADKLLEGLRAHHAKMEQFEHTAKTYASYQTLFGEEPHEFLALEKGLARCEGIVNTWAAIDSWNSKKENWMTCQFTDIEVEEMEKEVQVLFKDAYSMHKKIDTPASEMLKDSVAELKGMIPISSS